MTPGEGLALPAWAAVGEKRRAHIGRVVELLDRWAAEMRLTADEAERWRRAGMLHDALRDLGEDELRAMTGDPSSPVGTLHGPAAARRLEEDGEGDRDVLEAVRWHTVGCARWSRVGRALYMADYLEPGRPFAQGDRRFLASHVAHDFDGAFRQVVRHRLEWTVREGKELFPRTVELWNAVR